MNIEKERFEAWLFNQPKDRTVDLWNGSDCLLCKFIRETTNHRSPMVSWTMFRADDYWQEIPGWAKDFVRDSYNDWHADRHYRFLNTNPRIGVYDMTFGVLQDRFRKMFPIEKESLADLVLPELKSISENSGPYKKTSIS